MADEYVELNIRSQDFTTKTNEKFTLFPLIKNRKVDGIIIAVLKENDTQVEFLKMYTEAENYNKILELFKEAYLKNTLQQRISAKGNGNCSSDGSPCDTGEVVITMPGTGGGIPGGIWNGGPPPGGCQPYDNCLNPEGPGGTGGGEGNGPTPTGPQLSPCEKIKAENLKQPFKDKVAELDKKQVFDKIEETGFAAAYGTHPFEQLANTANDNLKFLPGNKYYGYMHTHLDSKDGVIKIFSPADISTFLTSCVRNAQANGSMEDAYGMVITSQGNYILKYSGDGNFGVGPNQEKNWLEWYEREFAKIANEDGSFSQNKVENLFARFLIEKVKIDGLEVYKSEKTTGNTSRLEYSTTNNAVKLTNCP